MQLTSPHVHVQEEATFAFDAVRFVKWRTSVVVDSGPRCRRRYSDRANEARDHCPSRDRGSRTVVQLFAQGGASLPNCSSVGGAT